MQYSNQNKIAFPVQFSDDGTGKIQQLKDFPGRTFLEGQTVYFIKQVIFACSRLQE